MSALVLFALIKWLRTITGEGYSCCESFQRLRLCSLLPAAATCQCHRPIDFLLTSSSSGTDAVAFGGRWQCSIKVFTPAVIDVWIHKPAGSERCIRDTARSVDCTRDASSAHWIHKHIDIWGWLYHFLKCWWFGNRCKKRNSAAESRTCVVCALHLQKIYKPLEWIQPIFSTNHLVLRISAINWVFTWFLCNNLPHSDLF